MANFTRVKPAGYAANEKLTSAQANQLDIDHAKSVNGDDGGTYAGALTWEGKHTLSGTGAGLKMRQGTGLADSDATIDTSKDDWYSTAVPTVPRTITLRSTTAPVPTAGEKLTAHNVRTSAVSYWKFVREDATELARIDAIGNGTGFVTFQWVTDGTPRWVVHSIGGPGATLTAHT